MITDIKTCPIYWKKEIFIASKTGVDFDEEGNEITKYSNPVKYSFNIQPVSSNAEIAEFGERVSSIKKAVIPISYSGTFKEFDVAYFDGATPNGETENGQNANYKLLPPREGNAVIIIYFEKLAGK